MRVFLLLLFSILSASVSYSQAIKKCGYSYVHNEVAVRYPAVRNLPGSPSLKTTADSIVTIPVVFHIVLTQQQQLQLGGETVIRRFIDTQVLNVTRDFMAMNADSVKIPSAFKPLYGNAGIQFALAHTAPDGSATPGYEIKTATLQGFNFTVNTYGSETAFSDAKYDVSGGLDAWDPSTYLNIWVINTLNNNSASDILGLCIPPSFAYERNFPLGEVGIVINYRNWRTSLNTFKGRTLTHELGHFFELRHIWGDDEGKCPATGGDDDGIDDTPLQAYENYLCPTFPKLDGCTKTYPGLMFMNFMDYTDDNCQQMFTHQQVARMRSQVQPFGLSYPLTQHPEVLKYPNESAENSYVIYPNPGDGRINIRFNRVSDDVKGIRVVNMLGQTIVSEQVGSQRGFYYFDLSRAGSGIYFVQIKFANKTEVQKLLVR